MKPNGRRRKSRNQPARKKPLRAAFRVYRANMSKLLHPQTAFQKKLFTVLTIVATTLAALFTYGTTMGHKDFPESYWRNIENAFIGMVLWCISFCLALIKALRFPEVLVTGVRRSRFASTNWYLVSSAFAVLLYFYRISHSDYW